MRPLPHLQVVEKRHGIAEYSVTSRAALLSASYLEVLLFAWFLYLYLSAGKHISGTFAATAGPLVLWGCLKRQMRRRESLLVIRDIGAQLSNQVMLEIALLGSRPLSIPLSGSSKLFIPASSIQELVLLEGIQGWSIIWYLAIAQQTRDATKLHVIFSDSLPGLSTIREVWQGARRILLLKDRSG